MARDQVEEVKSKTDIVSVIGEHLELKKAGRNYKALCPFHSEKTPSFMVSPELQIFKCFSCGEAGDVFTFLERQEGMEFSEALQSLAERAGVKLKRVGGVQRSDKEQLYDVNALAAKFYSYVLLDHPAGKEALLYLTKNRGLSLDTIRKFGLGYSPQRPGVLVNFLSKKKVHPSVIQKAGLVYTRGRGMSDRFRGRVIFPLHDHRGNNIGFAGRILPGVKTDMAKYINTPETPVYHKGSSLYGLHLNRGEIKKRGWAVVVEGELDMISSWDAGVVNTVAVKGTALTEDQLRILNRFADRLVLALDSDIAGNTAARRGIAIAQELGLEISVANLGESKDPDEMARKAPDDYKSAIKKAVNVWDFIIDSIFSKHDVSTGLGKSRISREIVPELSGIKDRIVQSHYVSKVALRLGVDVDAVFSQMTQSQEVGVQKPSSKISSQTKSRRELLEERLVALVIDGAVEPSKETLFVVDTPRLKRILSEYFKYTKESKSPDRKDFLTSLPAELKQSFMSLVFGQDLRDEEVREASSVLKELQRLALKERLVSLGVKIKQAENKGVDTTKLQKEFGKLSSKLAGLA